MWEKCKVGLIERDDIMARVASDGKVIRLRCYPLDMNVDIEFWLFETAIRFYRECLKNPTIKYDTSYIMERDDDLG